LTYRNALRFLSGLALAVMVQLPAPAQYSSYRARITGGDGGKCTFEIEVDGVAEVEISGDQGYLRTISGSPANWRRLDCTQPLPRHPNDFRFKGIDGRGRQDLVRDPNSNHGRALIRVEDPQGGREGYTGDITWNGGSGSSHGGSGGYGWGSQNNNYDDWNHSNNPWNQGGGWNQSNNSGWDNGWGKGNGWVSNGNFNYEGGRRGSGQYRDRNGDRKRLDTVKMFIGSSGVMAVEFQSDRGLVEFGGKVVRRDGRRVYCQVKGASAATGASGTMQIEMANSNQVRSITLPEIDLRWSN
jgi:hypothetical protein